MTYSRDLLLPPPSDNLEVEYRVLKEEYTKRRSDLFEFPIPALSENPDEAREQLSRLRRELEGDLILVDSATYMYDRLREYHSTLNSREEKRIDGRYRNLLTVVSGAITPIPSALFLAILLDTFLPCLIKRQEQEPRLKPYEEHNCKYILSYLNYENTDEMKPQDLKETMNNAIEKMDSEIDETFKGITSILEKHGIFKAGCEIVLSCLVENKDEAIKNAFFRGWPSFDEPESDDDEDLGNFNVDMRARLLQSF